VLLADGRVAGELDRPDRASIADALQHLGSHR
jgi:putative ABC transport system ATP-binding protein